jgi:hypothetical protein
MREMSDTVTSEVGVMPQKIVDMRRGPLYDFAAGLPLPCFFPGARRRYADQSQILRSPPCCKEPFALQEMPLWRFSL